MKGIFDLILTLSFNFRCTIDDDGILSSESEDADLESEDDEDDFEEIDM